MVRRISSSREFMNLDEASKEKSEGREGIVSREEIEAGELGGVGGKKEIEYREEKEEGEEEEEGESGGTGGGRGGGRGEGGGAGGGGGGGG